MKGIIQNFAPIFTAFFVGVLVYIAFSLIYFYNGLFNTFLILPIYAVLHSLVFLSLVILLTFLLKKNIYKIKNLKKVLCYGFFIGLIFLFFSPFFGIVSRYMDYEAHQHFYGPNWIVSLLAYFLIIFSVFNFFKKKQA